MTWPNLLSVLRLGLLPLFIIAVIERKPFWALLLFLVAALTDLLDGFIARFLKQESKLGAYLDPMADKLLLTAAFVTLSIPDLYPGLQIPIWITAMVITRDVLIVLGALIIYWKLGYSKFSPSRVSKWNTFSQLGAVFAVLLTGFHRSFDLVAMTLLWIMLVLTVISGLEYGYRFVYRVDRLVAEVGDKSDGR